MAHHQKRNSKPGAKPGKQRQRPIPYTFVPVEVSSPSSDQPARATAELFDVPGHSGESLEPARISGKLRLTMTAHTPLLVGSRRFKEEKQPEGSIVTPWRLADRSDRVVIPGSSLKGMIRHYLSALLNAPMEKVQEQYFSYRPNLGLPQEERPTDAFRWREAVIERAPDAEGNDMKVRVLPPGRQSFFLLHGRHKQLGLEVGDVRPFRHEFGNLSTSRPRKRRGDYQLIRYNGGIAGVVSETGEGTFSKLHAERQHKNTEEDGKKRGKPPRKVKLHDHVLTPTKIGKRHTVSQRVVRAYQRTQGELADTDFGHSSSRNPNIGSDREKGKSKKQRATKSLQRAKALRLLKRHTLIYVELNANDEIVSFGHHFRYRWAYRDSIRKLARGSNRPATRPEVGVDASRESSERLTAARAIFGYAVDSEIHDDFKPDYSSVAGRIALNHGLEVLAGGRNTKEERFVHNESSRFLQMKELSSPKASAVEFYIQQRPDDNEAGCLTTYGDLDDGGQSLLAGRKFYRHQPPAAKTTCYLASTQKQDDAKRASIAHCVSTPGAQFRFTLRYQDLSPVELGALLYVLGIQHADDFEREDVPEQEHVDDPNYALKIGFGRPLGLGSVTLSLDEAECLETIKSGNEAVVDLQPVTDVTGWRQRHIKAFLDEAQAKPGLSPNRRVCLDAWSYAGRGLAAYPTVTKEGKVYTFHTLLRRDHSVARRTRPVEAINESVGLAKPSRGGRERDE